MITAGWALALCVALVGGLLTLVGALLRLVHAANRASATARRAGGRTALVGLGLFVVTTAAWFVMIALGQVFGW